MVTYSDDHNALDIHGWNYYPIDDIFSLFMHCPWYLEWLRYASITHRYFFAGNVQIVREQAPLMDFCGQPVYG